VSDVVPAAIEHVPEITVNDTSPVPLPPLDVSAVDRPYGADEVETVRVAWLAFDAVIVKALDVTAS
jgi:hypothetical protein